MAGETKQIRISFSVDTASAAAARRVMAELIADAAKLSQAMGGGLHVPGAGAGGQQGNPLHAAQQATQTANPGVGLGNALTRAVQVTSGAMRQAAEGTRTALRGISDSLRDAASAGDPHLRRLETAAKGVAAAFAAAGIASRSMTGSLRDVAPGGRFGAQAGGPGQPPPIPAAARAGGGEDPQGLADTIGRAIRDALGAGGGRGVRFSDQFREPEDTRLLSHDVLTARRHEQGGAGTPRRRTFLEEMGEGGSPLNMQPESVEAAAERIRTGGRGPGMLERLGGGVSSYIQNRFGLSPAATRLLGAGSGVAAAGYAAYKAYDWLSNAVQNNQVANMQEQLRAPGYSLERRAVAGQTFGQLGLQIQGGSLSRAVAMTQVLNDPEFRKEVSQEALAKRTALSAVSNKLATEQFAAGLPPTPQAVFSQLGQRSGALATDVVSRVATSDVGDLTADVEGFGASPLAQGKKIAQRPGIYESTTAPNRLAFNLDVRQMSEKMMQRMVERMDREQQANPQLAQTLDSIMGEAGGRLSLARAAGVGAGPVVDKKTGKVIGDTLSRFQQGALRAGFDPGELAGANQALAGVAGRGFMGRGGSILGMQTGGLSNAAQLYAAGSQTLGYEGRGTPALLQAVQGSVGAGGLDVLAGSGLGGAVAGQLQAGLGTIGGADAMRGFAAAAFVPGAGPGRDMLQSRIVQAGMGGMETSFKGTGSPLDRALSAKAAADATGGNAYAMDALLSLSATELMEITRSGKVPRELAAAGITPGMVSAFVASRQKTQMANAMGRHMTGELRETFERFQGVGFDPKRLLRKLSSDAVDRNKGRPLSAAQRRGVTEEYQGQLRTIARNVAADNGMDPQALLGSLLNQGALGGGEDVRGGGAHDPVSRKAIERTAMRTRAGTNQVEEEQRAEADALAREVLPVMPALSRGAQAARKTAAASAAAGGDLAASSAAVTAAFDDLAKVVGRVSAALGRLAPAAGAARARPAVGR